MSTSFADDRFAHLPLGDLQGIISLNYHVKEENDAVLHERQVCAAEIARIGRSIDTMGEISLPYMSGTSRSASAVRDARTGSVSQGLGGASSRSTSVQNNNKNNNNNNNDEATNQSTISARGGVNQSYTDDPNARSESIAACSHEIQDAVKVVTTFKGDSGLNKQKKQPQPITWQCESKIKNLRTNEDYDSALEQRKQGNKDNGTLRRPEFRKLAPTWNRHQHLKHKQTSAKIFKGLGDSPYKADESGNVAEFSDEKQQQKHDANRQHNEELMQRNAENSLWSMHFGVHDSTNDAALAKKRDEDRKALMKTQAEERNRTSPTRNGKKNWTFQVPSLLARRGGAAGGNTEEVAPAAAQE